MTVYFEDIEIGRVMRSGAYTVEREEMVAFAVKWDPRPFHVDEALAKKTLYGALTASAAYTMSVYLKLINELTGEWATLGALGWDEVRFPAPVRAGDALTITVAATSKRPSRSRPGIGIVESRQRVLKEGDEPVLTFTAAFMMAMKEGS